MTAYVINKVRCWLIGKKEKPTRYHQCSINAHLTFTPMIQAASPTFTVDILALYFTTLYISFKDKKKKLLKLSFSEPTDHLSTIFGFNLHRKDKRKQLKTTAFSNQDDKNILIETEMGYFRVFSCL